MKYFLATLFSILIIQDCVAPPVEHKKKEEAENEVPAEDLAAYMEYHRYLQEVVKALESDVDFRKKLESVDESEIRSGKIAHELEFVSHHVRSKLDELKRQELERLRHFATKEFELENGLDPRHMKISEHLEHVDHTNPHTFEIDDLKKLIAKTTKDLDEADKKRREEFKEYEMNKKFEQEEKMKNMTEEDKTKYENELHDLEKKHKEHEPLHHPGSKKQLEEVWEKQDHMENQNFDPRTFFYLHDLDGNGVWDPTEVKALFLKELDKLYSQGAPEDDIVERAEEMERMREHVMKEADLNKDGLISYDEFLAETKKVEFEQDPGWEALDEQKLYSEQEYEEFRRQKAREIERHIAQGMFPPHPNQIHQDYMQQVPPQQYHPQQGQYGNQMTQQGQYNQQPPHPGQYPNQMAQQQYQQQQQFHPNQQIPVQNLNQVPQQQNYPSANQQMPHQQFQQPPNMNQVPQQQMDANQVPQQQFQQPINTNQAPQQQFQQPINTNQVPQQQFQQPMINNHQVPQQHFQQPINTNQYPQQHFQQPINTNQIPQQQYQQQPNSNKVPQQTAGQNQAPVANNMNEAPAAAAAAVHQQNQPTIDQNQQNTQNQIPQQVHQ
ncbi:nucleobindin-2 isoform X2 [Phymastichus coffea]|uniref:nucleobindin-2 isoform X2 n=1 Tax=Phymastichus coffea TaxID=108790 RepID=UPI00273C0A49|nr:nucleobindin-2 isoform X2 [Phymastichus coffea]